MNNIVQPNDQQNESNIAPFIPSTHHVISTIYNKRRLKQLAPPKSSHVMIDARDAVGDIQADFCRESISGVEDKASFVAI